MKIPEINEEGKRGRRRKRERREWRRRKSEEEERTSKFFAVHITEALEMPKLCVYTVVAI